MCAAARTAPKAHRKDTLHTLVLTGDEKEMLAPKMEKVGTREMGYAENVLWLGVPVSVSGKNIFFDRGIFHD